MVAKSKDTGAVDEANLEEPPALGAALREYVSGLSDDDKPLSQTELGRFARWVGHDRKITSMTPPEIGDYSDHIGARGTAPDAVERLGVVKQFLAHLKKKGLIEVNLAQHLRLRRGRASAANGKAVHPRADATRLTRAGHREMEQRLVEYRHQRVALSDDIRKAAADKDVRENAPLEAAREAHGLVSLKISEIESALQGAVIIEDKSGGQKGVVRLGGRVTLKDLSTGRSTACQLVHPDEANPLSGKISSGSPVGGAIIGHSVGDRVEVRTPGGIQNLEIIKAT